LGCALHLIAVADGTVFLENVLNTLEGFCSVGLKRGKGCDQAEAHNGQCAAFHLRHRLI
jgi:hypothetical protein